MKSRVETSDALRLLALFVIIVAPTTAAQRVSPPFPARLDSYVRNTVKLTAAEQKQLGGGEPVTRLLAADQSKEVAVFGAIWINAPMRR
jgi:hypothetical protein